MDRYGVHHTTLTIALLGGLSLAIIMDLYGGPQTFLTIALYGGLYLAIIMDLWSATNCPHYINAWRHLLSHYNGPL
jgi:hypothetical protein